MKKNNKAKIIILSAIAIGLVVVSSFTAFSRNQHISKDEVEITTEGLTEIQTEKATQPETLYTVKINSYDKNVLTDKVSFKLVEMCVNGKTNVINEKLETQNGKAEFKLKEGSYLITSSNGVFEKEITINDKSNDIVISAENNRFYDIMKHTQNICVVGDSITAGSKTDGHGWFENLIAKFKNIKNVDVSAVGGQTSKSIFYDTDNLSVIQNSSADTFIIALGVNDVLYRTNATRYTSYTTSEYIGNLERLVNVIQNNSFDKEKNIIFVAPFEYINRVSYQFPKYLRSEDTHEEYVSALYQWCKEKGYAFVSPMNTIKNTVEKSQNPLEYTDDDLHPTYPLGTSLYSDAVYDSANISTVGSLEIGQKFYIEQQRNKTDEAYKSYPIDYVEITLDKKDIPKAVFTIQDYSSGEYIELETDDKGNYVYEKSGNIPCYYSPKEVWETLKVSNLPVGGYVVKLTSYDSKYMPYITARTVFVDGSNISAKANILFNAEPIN